MLFVLFSSFYYIIYMSDIFYIYFAVVKASFAIGQTFCYIGLVVNLL